MVTQSNFIALSRSAVSYKIPRRIREHGAQYVPPGFVSSKTTNMCPVQRFPFVIAIVQPTFHRPAVITGLLLADAQRLSQSGTATFGPSTTNPEGYNYLSSEMATMI